MSQRIERKPLTDFDSWSNYWAGGVMTSLPEDFSGNYDGEIAEFWYRQFEGLPARASLLDVCTGNGAIALLAAQYKKENQTDFTIQALDAAQIYPERLTAQNSAWRVYLSQVEFTDQTPFESFSAPVHSFDLIFSQYGLEYCDLPAAAVQCKRLIKPGGRLVIVSHAVDTEILTTMFGEYKQYQQLINSALIQSIRSAMQSGKVEDPVWRQIERAIGELQDAQVIEWAPVIDYALQLARHVQAAKNALPEAGKAQIIAACSQLEHGYARLTHMLAANQKINESSDWTQVFVEHGLARLEQGSIRYSGKHRVGDYYIFSQQDYG
ncbi:MAG: class I SAM-dependent methyltransferase [Pseudomonadota bacterium]